jgi:protein-S-isoprenylcysteine O-methyltransferase Ste14
MEPGRPQVNDTTTASVIARPPLLFLAALLLGFVCDRLLPLPLTGPGATWEDWTVAGSLILIGFGLAAAGIRNFSWAATPVPTNELIRALVTTGIHAWSRNPIYVGLFLVYGGIGIAARSPWALILMLPLAVHDPLRCRCARGGVLGTAVRRRLPRLQSPRAPLAVPVSANSAVFSAVNASSPVRIARQAARLRSTSRRRSP